MPSEVFAFLQTAVWSIHSLEDNAFALFRFASGAVASFHTSSTQWKNLFSFEVFGERGSLNIEGLGGSYGTERLIVASRKPEGGVPVTEEESFEGLDLSWQAEWADFIRAVTEKRAYWGTPEDGVAVMTLIDALYRSERSGVPIRMTEGDCS
jgi:predicted dehydrogenase